MWLFCSCYWQRRSLEPGVMTETAHGLAWPQPLQEFQGAFSGQPSVGIAASICAQGRVICSICSFGHIFISASTLSLCKCSDHIWGVISRVTYKVKNFLIVPREPLHAELSLLQKDKDMSPQNDTLSFSWDQGWTDSEASLYSPVHHFVHMQDGCSPYEPRERVHRSFQVLHTALTTDIGINSFFHYFTAMYSSHLSGLLTPFLLLLSMCIQLFSFTGELVMENDVQLESLGVGWKILGLHKGGLEVGVLYQRYKCNSLVQTIFLTGRKSNDNILTTSSGNIRILQYTS